MKMDEILYGIAEKVANFAAIYLCDIDAVPDFNEVCSSFYIYLIALFY